MSRVEWSGVLLNAYSQKCHPYFRISVRQPTLRDEGAIIERFIATDRHIIEVGDFDVAEALRAKSWQVLQGQTYSVRSLSK